MDILLPKNREQKVLANDPLFIPEGYDKSFAELGEDIKKPKFRTEHVPFVSSLNI